MDDVSQRLAGCFRAVFPGLNTEQLPSTSITTLAAWDSVAHVTLLSAISEEFGVDFELQDFEELVSYARILDYLRRQAVQA